MTETLTDADLDQTIGAALLDGVDTTELDAERVRRRLNLEHQQLAGAERTRRLRQDRVGEARRLLQDLITLRDELRAKFLAEIMLLQRTADFEKSDVIERAYELGRQAYSLAHDLHGVTGDPRHQLRYDVSDQLLLHGGRTAEAFLLRVRGWKTVGEKPWSSDITRLRELMPRVERIGNGG